MNTSPATPAEQAARLQQVLGGGARRGFLSRLHGWLVLAVLLALIAVPAWLYLRADGDAAAPRYRTEPVTIGTLVVKVSATGNLMPTNQVDVGSELSGIVEKVLVDDNDRVKKGQLLAQLDLSKLNDAVARSRANLAAAEAQVLQNRATVAEARANLARFRQVAELSGGKVPSKSELDTAEANLKRAEANEANALAAVAQVRATLQSDETNLAKAHIRSPIDGVVLARKMEPGQTVAASFQAPVLFSLAEDLAQMELQVDVDEADVGRVQVGQPVSFTVDAWPGRSYPAAITRVGYGSQVKDGVVSYPTVLRVDNDDLSLRPGMTATAEITTLVRENALLVPNAALRFTPPAATPATKSAGSSLLSALLPRPPRRTPTSKPSASPGGPRVWVLRDGQPTAIEVKTGATNGRVTEIVGGSIEPGTEAITEVTSAKP